MPIQSPLTEEHLRRLDRLLEACVETREYCAKCKRCGLDVERELRMTSEQEEVAKRIKAEFFPNAK